MIARSQLGGQRSQMPTQQTDDIAAPGGGQTECCGCWAPGAALEQRGSLAALATALLTAVTPASAHPHVFVDGGVDFVLRDGNILEALEVTWLYDEFETLYILSSYGLSLNDAGGLDEADRQELVRLRSDWPDDFDGSAHLSADGVGVALEWPTDLDARLIEGRLEVTFTRYLETPMPLGQRLVEVAFYESTYFFAFSATKNPILLGDAGHCTAGVLPFDPDPQDTALQAMLSRLSREETPGIENVGALFADRIVVRCA